MTDTKKTKTVFRLWWAWNDEQEERWLEARAREGWHLKAYRPFFCTLEAGPPAEMAYRFDYQSASSLPVRDREEYLALFRDAGWELVGDYAGWHCFRTPAGPGPAPEIHTDAESRIGKYRRLMGVLGFFMIFLVLMLVSQGMGGGGTAHSPFLLALYGAARFIQFILALLFGYAIIRLGRRIRKLREKMKD